MIRKLLIGILLGSFAGALVWGYFYFRQVNRPINNAFLAVPMSAAVIFEFDHSEQTLSRLDQTNVLWEALKSTGTFSKLHNAFLQLDSMLKQNKTLHDHWAAHPFIAAICKAGANRFGFLFIQSLPAISDNALTEWISGFATKPSVSKKSYDGADVITLTYEDGKFSYALYKGLFIGSHSLLILEDAVRQINAQNSLLNDPQFMKVYRTAGHHVDARIYIRHNSFPELSGIFLNHEAYGSFSSLNDYADWTELDLKLKPAAIMLNGFSIWNENEGKYLEVYRGSSPLSSEMPMIFPHNTAVAFISSSEHFKDYYQAYKKYLDKKQMLFEFEKRKNALETSCRCDIQKGLLSWMDNETGLIITEAMDTSLFEHAYVILKTKSPENTALFLRNMSVRSAASTGVKPDSSSFKQWPIRKCPLKGMLGTFLGPMYSLVKDNYYVIIDDYVVFANTVGALVSLLRDYDTDRTLGKDIHYSIFSDNLSAESNMYFYCNIARSANCFKKFANKAIQADLQHNEKLIKQFEAAAFQISNDKKNFFYNNFYLNYNPVYKEETALIFQTDLDTNLYKGPFMMRNHYTRKYEILVQDMNGTLYLISPTGSILWKRALPEKIAGTVQQIDALRNGKLQMTFNSKNHIWLIDRNGNDVQGFPVKLPAEASAPLSVFDYDKTRKYRLIIPCRDRNIYNYDQTGRIVKGWEAKATSAPVLLPLQHTVVNGKDYIILIDSIGQVSALNRKGHRRIAFSHKLPVPNDLHSKKTVFVEQGRDLAHTYLVCTDSAGTVVKLSFDDHASHIQTSAYSSSHSFVYNDIDGDGSNDFVFLDGKLLNVYAQDKTKLFSYEFDSACASPPLVFDVQGKGKHIAVISDATDEVFLFDSNGYLQEGFPLQGRAGLCIEDLQQDKTCNLVTTSGHKLMVYIIE